MKLNRPWLRQQARRSMAGVRPSSLWVSLVYLLLTGGTTLVVSMLAAKPLMDIAKTMASSGRVNYNWMARELLSAVPFWVGCLAVLALIGLFSWVLSYGYQVYVLALAKGEQAGMGTLLTGFSVLGRVLGLNLLLALLGLLWSVVTTLPALLVNLLAVWLGTAGHLGALYVLLSGLALVLELGGLVLYCVIMLRYALATLALADHPELRTLGALRRSKELMAGMKWELVKLLLSFFGWIMLLWAVFMVAYFLAAVMLGMAVGISALGATGAAQAEQVMLAALFDGLWAVPVVVAVCAFLYLMWLMPYISVTMAHFYRVMCQEREEKLEEPSAPPSAGGGGGDERTVPYWEQPYRSLEGENGAASDSRRDPDRPF